MNLTKLYMWHEDQNTARSFLVFTNKGAAFGCICKRCLRRIYEASSQRVGERLRFKVTCNSCKITEQCSFTTEQIEINEKLFYRLSIDCSKDGRVL